MNGISEAEKRLKELEDEKQRLDEELRAAQEKISKTEHTAQALHVQLRVRYRLLPTTKSTSYYCR